ncbi:MAG: amidase [Xanthomonadales bacterium]|nr:amidase [Xanthomonadales bacterium]
MNLKLLAGLMVLVVSVQPHSLTASTPAEIERFANLALACVHEEYPNKISHVLSGDQDVAPPRELTPVFYGCFDWHSSVHGHWLLVRLLRLYPDAGFAPAIEAALDKSFSAENVAVELGYVTHEQRASFERPYGVAWLLQLTAELHEWDDPRAKRWLNTLTPVETVLVENTQTWLGKLAYPIRIGEHAQTAFAFGLFLDYAEAAGNTGFRQLVANRSKQFYLGDRDCPLAYEPGGQDFLSPCLAEADLMRRLLPAADFASWLTDFLPGLPTDGNGNWLPLAIVTDPTDGKLAHLDGLNISRAWMLEGIASGLPPQDVRRPALLNAAAAHKESGLASVTGEHYEGGHWLGSFATYLQTARGLEAVPQTAETTQLAQSRLRLMESQLRRWEQQLNAVIALNPDAAETAVRLDEESAKGESRGPLHGFPVLLKDNIETRDMPTTAGSLALKDNRTDRDAEITRRLREAGLVIAGKTNLSEWANFRDNDSSSGWSAVGGLTVNAWDQGRTACGSSSGSAVAVAAGYVPFAVGTETNGSVICPAAVNGVVGIKPTLGLVSRRGIVPIAHSQDTAGPMATDVASAAMLLSAMEGVDPEDPLTTRNASFHGRDYVRELRRNGLEGLRVGVIRSQTFHSDSAGIFDQAVADMEGAGAIIIEDLTFPDWPEGFWDDALNVLYYEFKHDLNRYFATLPGSLNMLTLAKLIAFNHENAAQEMPWFGQDLFEEAQSKNGLDSDEYKQALATIQTFTRSAVDSLLEAHDVEVLVMRSNAPAFVIDLVYGDNFQGGASSMAAIAGYPHITVPMGRWKDLPLGLSFVGTAFSEPALLRAAYAYEQATGHGVTLAGGANWNLDGLIRSNN